MLAKKRETDSSRFSLVQAVGTLKRPNSISVYVITEVNGIRMLDARRLKRVHPVFSVWWAAAPHTDPGRRKGQAGRANTQWPCERPCLLALSCFSFIPIAGVLLQGR